MIIGITGGSGCGKTTALKVFETLGGMVLDCDAIYHRLLATDPSLTAAIEARFPGTVKNGVLDRKKLGSIVFADTEALQALNAITHSAVKREVLRQMAGQTRHIAIDAIGLFEGDLAELCQTTVAVTAPEEDRITRLMERDQISEEYARARITAQRSQEEFSRLCEYTLINNGSREEFEKKCFAFFRQIGIM